MPDLFFPSYTKKILSALNAAGYEAYLVGGAVRDLLLGKSPDDYDITTNALPEQVLAVCKQNGWKTVDQLGHNFGCVVIVIDGVATEVTTFRGERYNDDDMHRPAATWFCSSLREDLSRRDFTVNAMALSLDGTLYDYFGGQQDLQQKILRTVGNAKQRFHEDALRMLRACRFVSQLGFTYEQAGCEALPACGAPNTPYYLPHGYSFPVERCAGLSLERVRKELEKLITSEYAGKGLMLMMATGLLGASCHARENGSDTIIPILPEALHLLGLHQNPRFHLYDTWEHTLLAIDNSPHDLAIRWALVLHDLGKGLPNVRKLNKESQPSDPGHEAESAIMAKAILTRLGYNNSFVHLVTWLVAQHMRFAPMLLTGEHPAALGAQRSRQLRLPYAGRADTSLQSAGRGFSCGYGSNPRSRKRTADGRRSPFRPSGCGAGTHTHARMHQGSCHRRTRAVGVCSPVRNQKYFILSVGTRPIRQSS